MANAKNKTISFLSISFLLSVLLHLGVLAAFSDVNGLPFNIPFANRVIMVELQTPGKHFPAPGSGPSILREKSEEEATGSDIVSKEEHEKSGGTHDIKAQDQILINPAAKPSTETAIEPAETTNTGGDPTSTREESPEMKRKPPQIARGLRETFSYDIYWIGIKVGNASLEAVQRNGLLKIITRANSSAFISTFYQVTDYAESLVMDGVPVNFRIKQIEGKYKSDKETIFDGNSKNVTFFNHLKGTKDEHAITNKVAWDVISGFYYLRTQPLEVGKRVFIDIFDSNKFYKAEISVLRREKIALPGVGEVNTVVLKPELKSDGLFQRKGDILIWLTDDEKRIPIRVETKVPVGDVVAELKNFTLEN